MLHRETYLTIIWASYWHNRLIYIEWMRRFGIIFVEDKSYYNLSFCFTLHTRDGEESLGRRWQMDWGGGRRSGVSITANVEIGEGEEIFAYKQAIIRSGKSHPHTCCSKSSALIFPNPLCNFNNPFMSFISAFTSQNETTHASRLKCEATFIKLFSQKFQVQREFL